MNKIALIYTTFLRDDLASKTITSIINNWNTDWRLLIGDQNPTDEKASLYANFMYYDLPFDCGLSYARNYLVKKAKELGYEYCLVTADSIEFTGQYNFEPIMIFMKDNGVDKVGFRLDNRVSWEYNIELIPGKHFELSLSNENLEYDGITYNKVDICKNFFLAKTDALINIPWDNELKLSEHEDHCWRLKQASYKTYFTNYIGANYVDNKPNEYTKYRQRMYFEYRKKLQEKYGIKGWIIKK